ncbi:hypothetical protein Zmor_015195 [Zophobas morio]|uniref:DUF8207 domain-containing protein n=1 Tax=Zophobas morio TaxID=2755281 RepID=A0AA38IHP1_9CUCU|nr:hypothetical protein Zmor_015195 [Zophobas morio]
MNDDEQLHRQQDDEETLDENFEKDVEEDEEVFEYKPEEEEMKTEYETASKLNLSDIKQPEVFEDFLFSQFPDISKPSIIKVLNEENDEVYGPRYDLETNKLLLGNITLNITDNVDFSTTNQLFPATEGLYTLLFSKNPDSETIVINDKDRKIYKQMLEISNAHKRFYDPEQQIKGSRGKHLQHIQPLFSKTTDKKKVKINPHRLLNTFPKRKDLNELIRITNHLPVFHQLYHRVETYRPTASIIPTRTTLMQ